MTPQPVLLERVQQVALITLNAPHKRNAIDRAMVDGLHRVFDELSADQELTGLIITG